MESKGTKQNKQAFTYRGIRRSWAAGKRTDPTNWGKKKKKNTKKGRDGDELRKKQPDGDSNKPQKKKK